MGEMERRRDQRVPVKIGTVYHDQIEVDGTDALMSDLSMGGCCIRTNRPSSPGSEVTIQLRLSADDPAYEARGLIRWVRDPMPDASPGDITGAMGIQFTEIDAEVLNRLKIFIADKAASELFD